MVGGAKVTGVVAMMTRSHTAHAHAVSESRVCRREKPTCNVCVHDEVLEHDNMGT